MEFFWGDEFLKNPQKNALPALGVGQLLRSCEQGLEEGAGLGELGFDFAAFGMAEVDTDAGLAGDASKQFGAGGDRFPVPVPIDQPGVEAPPVVDLGNKMGGCFRSAAPSSKPVPTSGAIAAWAAPTGSNQKPSPPLSAPSSSASPRFATA